MLPYLSISGKLKIEAVAKDIEIAPKQLLGIASPRVAPESL
jgi:hypothetical protein